jgi:hypothetical protein
MLRPPSIGYANCPHALGWVRKTTAAQFAAPDEFVNFVHMFDATVGFAFGDPNPVASDNYEVLRTIDAGETWACVECVSFLLNINELGCERACFARWFRIWVDTGCLLPAGLQIGSRIYYSADAGQT